MQLVATGDGVFSRIISTSEETLEADKEAILADVGDAETIVFTTIEDSELETPEGPAGPTDKERITLIQNAVDFILMNF